MKYRLARHYIWVGAMVLLVVPQVSQAQFVPLIPIPGIDPNNFDFERFLEIVYILAISAAALIAVIKLMLAGFKYIVSELVTVKSAAKKDIEGAVVGLIIILIATAILTTINTSLTNLPKLDHAPIFDGVPRQPRVEPVKIDPFATPKIKRGILTDEEILSLFEFEDKELINYIKFDNNNNTTIPGRNSTEVREFGNKCRNIPNSTRMIKEQVQNDIFVMGCLVDKAE